MKSCTYHVRMYHVRGPNKSIEQEDGDHAEVQAQRNPPTEEQVKFGPFFLNKSTNAEQNQMKIFQVPKLFSSVLLKI